MLILVRTEDRRDELAVCLSLGATRRRLARGIAVEGALLAAAGAALAIPIASWLFTGIRTFQLPGRVDIELLELSLDRQVWLVAAASALAVTVSMALLAATFALSASTARVHQTRGGATPRVTRRWPRAVFVAAQVAVTLVLAVGAGLFARSLAAALSLNAGVETSRIVTGTVTLAPYGYTPARAATFFTELGERLRTNRALQAVAVIRSEGGMSAGGSVTIDGFPREMPSFLAETAVDEHYFQTMGLPIVRGRGFLPSDTAGAPPVLVVSESFGRFVARGGDPIGHRITDTSWFPPNPPAVAEIVGVVPDVITNVNVAEPLVRYYAIAQRRGGASGTVVLRARSDSRAAVREAVAAIRDIDRVVAPGPMLTLEEQIGRQMNPQRFGVYVLGALGGMALLLASLGTYVLAASAASMRRREMSIRAALGARWTQIGGLVLKETVVLVGAGLAAGLALAWTGASMIRALLYRVEPTDPITLASVCALILGLALVVSLRPALESARVDLTGVLRE